jgi:NAD(P)-dependent dehydrogenase (short-subunit alcohol dehydrogenase family)
LGKALAEAVLYTGDRVIGTFRQEVQALAFTQAHQGQAKGMVLDVTQSEAIPALVAAIEQEFGRLDVLVNNAGFGFAGAIEESSEAEVRAVFEANFFGALHLTQAFLPLFRRQRAGFIIQVSSHGGIKAFPGFGIYNASKFALEGFSEALAAEIAPLGIRLSIVEPGPFRTGFAGTGFREANLCIEDYAATAGAFRERMRLVDGKQEGDPQKAAVAMVQLSRMQTPPLRLPLGKIALASISAKLASVQQDMEAGRTLAEGAVFG